MSLADLDHSRRNSKPRLLLEPERARLDEFIESIGYSARQGRFVAGDDGSNMLTGVRYSDNHYEYRHVQLPKAMLKAIPRDYFDPSKGTLKLLWEDEWRGLGITQVC